MRFLGTSAPVVGRGLAPRRGGASQGQEVLHLSNPYLLRAVWRAPEPEDCLICRFSHGISPKSCLAKGCCGARAHGEIACLGEGCNDG